MACVLAHVKISFRPEAKSEMPHHLLVPCVSHGYQPHSVLLSPYSVLWPPISRSTSVKMSPLPAPLQLAPEVQKKTNRKSKVPLSFGTALQIHECQLFSLRSHPLLNVYVV